MPRHVRPLTLTAALAAAMIVLPTSGSAQAAAHHFNTDPHKTGCAKSAFNVGSKGVSGGTVYIKASKNCGTNWIEYRGKRQTTTKTGKDHRTNRWSKKEVDTTQISWSMQSYAPGTTPYTGQIKIGRTTTTASCSRVCTWKSSTQKPTPTTLGKKVDAFAAKYNGRKVDFDGHYGPQCVDLFNYYNRDVVRANFASVGYASQLWNTHDTKRYTRIPASSTPRKGDVAVWSSSFPGSGGAGHVAIVLSSSGNTFTALSQNTRGRLDATGKFTFNKSYVRGYLRPKS